jgi:hypothetical protein
MGKGSDHKLVSFTGVLEEGTMRWQLETRNARA